MTVVSNTSPICYLELIGHLDLLFLIFGQIIIPPAVRDELLSEGAPPSVRTLMSKPPAWLEVRDAPAQFDPALDRLHPGEREAILLAEALRADLIILDERAARQIAEERGLSLTGLLGVLDEAATRNLVDLPEAVERLRQTFFRASPRLLKSLLDRHPSP